MSLVITMFLRLYLGSTGCLKYKSPVSYILQIREEMVLILIQRSKILHTDKLYYLFKVMSGFSHQFVPVIEYNKSGFHAVLAHKIHVKLHPGLVIARSTQYNMMTPPWMFPPLDIPFEYWIEHVTFRLLCVMFKAYSSVFYMFYMGFPGFATDCPCGIWCRGLTSPCGIWCRGLITCLVYVGPHFGFKSMNLNWVCKFDI